MKNNEWHDLRCIPTCIWFIPGHQDFATSYSKIEALKIYNRPIICSEYLARTNGSTFESILPILKENEVHAINWGFVSGKTNTIFPWSSWTEKMDSIPKIWHHDIYRTDKTPFSENEISFLKATLK